MFLMWFHTVPRVAGIFYIQEHLVVVPGVVVEERNQGRDLPSGVNARPVQKIIETKKIIQKYHELSYCVPLY